MVQIDLELVAAAVVRIEVAVAAAAAFVESHVEIHLRCYQVAAASFHVGLLAVADAACCCYLVVVEILYRLLLLLGVVALDSHSFYCKTRRRLLYLQCSTEI